MKASIDPIKRVPTTQNRIFIALLLRRCCPEIVSSFIVTTPGLVRPQAELETAAGLKRLAHDRIIPARANDARQRSQKNTERPV
jgi:hypothetical protein